MENHKITFFKTGCLFIQITMVSLRLRYSVSPTRLFFAYNNYNQ